MKKRFQRIFYSFIATKAALLFAIGRAFANDSPNYDVKPFWETWGHFFKEHYLAMGGCVYGCLLAILIYVFIKNWFRNRDEPDQVSD